MADDLKQEIKEEEVVAEEEVQNDDDSVKEEVDDDDNANEETNADQDNSPETKIPETGIFIRLRGLPWDVTQQDIVDFLADANVVNGQDGVYICKNRKTEKMTGEAYVHLETEEDEIEAFTHNKQDLGHRYIEIFKATPDEVDFSMNRSRPRPSKVVKLRGLPFSSTADTIDDFFEGLDVDREGIILTYNRQGRATGEAYVPFSTPSDAQKALERNREKIENRYIEIFPSSLMDLKQAAGMSSSPYDRPRSSGRGGNNGPNNRNNRRGEREGRRGDNNRGSWSNNFEGNGRRNNYGNNGGNFGTGGGGNFGMGGNSNFGMGNGNGNFGGGQFGTNNSNNNGVFCIRMRGLPYRAYENEISDFFSPLNTANVEVIYNKKGLHSGTANVYFASADDAILAMRKHNGQMGSRYIELFYDGNTSNGGRY